MSNENTGRRKIVNGVMIFLFVVGFSIYLTNFFPYKNRVFRMVKRNTDLLNHSIQSASYDAAYKIKGVKDIREYTNSDGTPLIDY